MGYAIVQCGGKQHRVTEGAKVRVEKLPAAVGAEVNLDRVLLASEGESVRVGKPTLPGCRVVAEVTAQARGPKLMVFHDNKRKGIRKHRGHRQPYTELRIKQIVLS